MTRITPDMVKADFWAVPDREWSASESMCSNAESTIWNQGMVYALGERPLKITEWSPDTWLDGPGFWSDGRPITAEERVHLRKSCQLEPTPHEFGISVGYAALRAWPSYDEIFTDAMDRIVERGQLSALHTGEAVRILGQNLDGGWYLVQCSTYVGWVDHRSLAWCGRDEFNLFTESSHYLVVVGRGASVEPDPYGDPVSRPLEFGAWIPMADPSPDPQGWQYRVQFPHRNFDGQLAIRPAYVPVSPAVHSGFLPRTRHALVSSAFTLLGDRYGWGGRLGRRDCSGFVMDVYRTLGIQIPRDASAQEEYLPSRPMGTTDKLKYALAGDLLPMPGHVMLYLGRHQETDFVAHAFVGYCPTPESELVVCNQVMVTPLNIYTRKSRMTYLDAITSICRIL